MRSRSGIESAFISRSWRSLVQPRMGRQFIAWRRQPQGIPNEPTIILGPRGGGRGNSRQSRRRCRVARADRDSQVSALSVGLRSGAPFRCKHRIEHRKRAPGQQEPCVAPCPYSCRWLGWLCWLVSGTFLAPPAPPPSDSLATGHWPLFPCNSQLSTFSIPPDGRFLRTD